MPLKIKRVRAGGVKVHVKKTVPDLELTTDQNLSTVSTKIEPEDDNNNNCQESLVDGLLKKLDDQLDIKIEKDDSSSLTLTDTKKESDTQTEELSSQVLLVGDLVWSKIPGHCWWPSMISYDPCDAIYFTKSKNGKDASKFHVQFFGDKSLRGWVLKSNIIKFKGKDHFLNLPTRLLKNKGPTSKQTIPWENAIQQANKALLVSRNERKLLYVFNYDDPGKKNMNEKGKKSNIKKPVNKKSITVKVEAPKSQAAKATKLKNVLKEIPAQNYIAQSGENNSDSGIEDLGESASDILTDENMEEAIEGKRKRKQKEFTDYHTGEEMTIAIKSTTWKPMPPLNDKKPRLSRKRKSLELSPAKNKLAQNENVSQIQQGKENVTIKKRGRPKRIPDEKVETEKLIAAPNPQLSDKGIKQEINEPAPKRRGRKKKNRGQEEGFTEIKMKQETPSIVNQESKTAAVKTIKKKKTIETMKPTSNEEEIDEKMSKIKRDEKDMYCSLCEETTGDLIPCCGDCFRYFHPDCLGLGCKPKTDFTCDECQTGHHMCFLCKETGDLTKCSQVTCGNFFHSDCIDKLQECEVKAPNGSIRFFCPHHSCKLCVESKITTKSDKAKIMKCIRCPTAYHQKTCFVAGCLILTPHFMICDQHYKPDKSKKNNNHVNVTWCFGCSHGGSLVCCDTCPASFHPECTNELTGVPEGAWKCKDCREHNKPKYSDIVWVKFGVYRWWPGRICFPEEIPERIQLLPHSLGEFPVMFFGSKDYSWIHSGRVFKYAEGDKGGHLKKSNSLGKYFSKALLEAKEAFAELKKEEAQISESIDRKNSLKPPPYKKIRSNRPVTCVRTVLDQCEWPICECSEEGGCTGESECLNRMLYFECSGKTCKAGNACQNKRMQKCQYKQAKPFKCEGRGWGLKADQEIKSGEFVIEYVGELIDEETCQQRVKEYHENDISHYYFLTIDRDNVIDAYPKGNLSRFMNHSCDPNCETQKWTVNGEVRVGLFATRDIAVGEELCFNYHLDCMGNDKKQCKCGAANCSGFLGVKPKTQHAMSVAEKAKVKKKKDKERRKLKKEMQKMQKIVHEDECFVCGDGGDLILCSRGKCTKSYHIKCLCLDKNPRGKWECPWHFCDSCGKPAKAQCALCTNSYCAKHQEGEMFPLRENVTVCSDHSEDEFKKFLMTLDEKLKAANLTEDSSDASSEMEGASVLTSKRKSSMKIANLTEDSSDASSEMEGASILKSKRKSKMEAAVSSSKKAKTASKVNGRKPPTDKKKRGKTKK